MRGAWLLIGAMTLSGCHAKFKREAGSLGAVRTDVVSTAGPMVTLGHLYDDSVAALVVNVVQDIRAIEPRRRIEEAVDLDRVNYALNAGVRDGLGEGPPFRYTEDPAAALLELELVDWGLYVPYLGAQGEFYYDLHVRIYKPDGDRVYRTRLHCDTAAGSPPPAALVFGAVDNIYELEQMSDAEIQGAFEAVASWCGGQLASKMRRHAG